MNSNKTINCSISNQAFIMLRIIYPDTNAQLMKISFANITDYEHYFTNNLSHDYEVFIIKTADVLAYYDPSEANISRFRTFWNSFNFTYKFENPQVSIYSNLTLPNISSIFLNY